MGVIVVRTAVIYSWSGTLNKYGNGADDLLPGHFPFRILKITLKNFEIAQSLNICSF